MFYNVSKISYVTKSVYIAGWFRRLLLIWRTCLNCWRKVSRY